MATFYAQYPSSVADATVTQTVQGEGTPGTPTGGVLTIQGDPAGTPVPVSGTVTTTNPSVSPTGAPVPADANYVALNSSGTLVGLTGTASGLNVLVNAALPAGANTIGAVTQASGPWTQNITQFGSSAVVIGTGVSGAGIPRVTVASDSSLATVGTVSTVTAVTAITNALPAGANTIGAVTQASGPWTVTGSGTAGTAAAGVVTIQGIASMTPVKVDGSGVTGPVNVTQFGGNNVVTGTGTSGVGIPRVTVSSDSSLTSVGTVSTVTAVTTVSTVSSVTAIANALPSGTNILGRVGIDQTTPGTTNAVQVTSGTTAVWQAEGSLAFGSITNTFQTVFTPAANTKILYMRNNTDAAISVSMDAGSTTNFVLDSGDQVSTDFVANGVKSPVTAIQIKYAVGAPTSGSFRVNGLS